MLQCEEKAININTLQSENEKIEMHLTKNLFVHSLVKPLLTDLLVTNITIIANTLHGALTSVIIYTE